MNVGPRFAPLVGISAIPAVHRSTSLTFLDTQHIWTLQLTQHIPLRVLSARYLYYCSKIDSIMLVWSGGAISGCVISNLHVETPAVQQRPQASRSHTHGLHRRVHRWVRRCTNVGVCRTSSNCPWQYPHTDTRTHTFTHTQTLGYLAAFVLLSVNISLNTQHCSHPLLPDHRNSKTRKSLRNGGHNYILSHIEINLFKNSFLNRCLYAYI